MSSRTIELSSNWALPSLEIARVTERAAVAAARCAGGQ